MEIDHRAKRVGALPERIERSVIEILTVGVAVDHRAAEFEIADATFSSSAARLGVLHRQMGEAGIAVRAFFDFAREKVVRTRAPCRVAVAASRSACTPGPAIERTARAMPASSMLFKPQFAEIGEVAKEVFRALRGSSDMVGRQ